MQDTCQVATPSLGKNYPWPQVWYLENKHTHGFRVGEFWVFICKMVLNQSQGSTATFQLPFPLNPLTPGVDLPYKPCILASLSPFFSKSLQALSIEFSLV